MIIFFYLSVIITILISCTAKKECRGPEKFRVNSCEFNCSLNQSPNCDYNYSGCFCPENKVRDLETGKCVPRSVCTKKLCGAHQMFVTIRTNFEVCTSNGEIYNNRSMIDPMSACQCKNNFIHSDTLFGECISYAECRKRTLVSL